MTATMLPGTPAQPPARTMPPPTKTPDQYRAEGHKIDDWATVQRWWSDIADELLVHRREMQLNEAFDRGDQHVTWNTATNQVTLRDLVGKERFTRMSVNKMRARRRATTARLTSSPMSMEVRPGMATDSAMRNQRMAEHVLQAMGAPEADDWEGVRAQAVTATLFGGVAAVCWEWDPDSANPSLADDATAPTDMSSGFAMPCGGIRLTALSVHEFGLEAGSRRQQDAHFWIRQYGEPPEQVQATYGLKAKPRADAAALTSPMGFLLNGGRRHDNLTAITVVTKRPHKGNPGCVAHYVNGQCVSYTPWPYPHPWLNLYVFRCDDPKTNTYLTDPWWSDLRQPQTAYNKVRKAISAHVDRAANARVIVPTGGVDLDAFTDEAGEVVEYDEEPKWMTPPEVARWLVGEVDRIDAEINDLAGSPDIARGVAPGDRNSGAALALLAEKADGPLGPFAADESRGWSVIATSSLRTLRHHMKDGERRQSTTYGPNGGVAFVRTWTRDDIDENVTVNVPLESVMPRSQTALRASLIEMHGAFPQAFEGLDGRTLAQITGLTSLRDMMTNLDPDQAFAEWENELMMAGEPVVPDEWHNHAVHLDRHERVRNSATYEMADEAIKAVFDDHIEAHHTIRQEQAQKAAQDQMAQMQAMGMPGGMPPGMPGAPHPDAEGPAEQASPNEQPENQEQMQ